MNIHNSSVQETEHSYFPLGNSRPVCLTQDLPPEQDADILLLGCGDARNVLFTCFADSTRKIDVTCCDIEPMIHARNVLLYTLLIDDESNKYVELIWNIYYHWKIDESSLKHLESQIEKLLKASDSIEVWNGSVYGSSIRFCDEKSLSSVRCHWVGFTSQGLSFYRKKKRSDQLQAAINRAKETRCIKGTFDFTGYHSLFPTGLNRDKQGFEDLYKATEHWWDHGWVPSSNSPSEPTHLNPVFLYSPNHQLTIFKGVTPFGGTPLNTAYISVRKESTFYIKNKGSSSTDHLVNCAKSHFRQWALAFRRSVTNGSIIRIFSGHAFSFCLTLRNCQLTESLEMNLFCHYWTNSPLILHPSDYGPETSAAPLSFDIIDTSNLADYLGPLNLIGLASRLLKYNDSSCLYTQLMTTFDPSVRDRMTDLLGVDVRSISLLLGLIPPDLFTNAASTVEEDPNICNTSVLHSRLRWRRFRGSNNSPHLQVQAEELAKFLIKVYNAVFELDNLASGPLEYTLVSYLKLSKLLRRPYNCASFAFLLSILKATVISDWDKCLKEIYSITKADTLYGVVENKRVQDLLLNLHIFGVDSSLFIKPNPAEWNSTILASLFPKCNGLPEQLCVTVRVPREYRKDTANISSHIGIVCSFEGRDSNGQHLCQSFSSVQIAFGKWHEENEEGNLYPFIEEDIVQVSCTSDMFASFMVPTSMLLSILLQSKKFVPVVKCRLNFSLRSLHSSQKYLVPDLCFFSTEITSEHVYVTQFMPGMSGHPKFFIPIDHLDTSTSSATVVRFSDDGSKINSLIQRITLESEADKTTLALKSSAVKVKDKSQFNAVVCIGESLRFKLELPVPVSVTKHKGRIARKSSYVEIEFSLFDPVEEEASSFLLPYFLAKTPFNPIPVAWTSTRLDLNVMPPIDLNDTDNLSSWLPDYAGQMFSKREHQMALSETYNFLVKLKGHLKIAFTSYASTGVARKKFFIFEDMVSNVKLLILPSCLRLDLANYTIALDSALIPFTNAVSKDPIVTKFLKEFETNDLLTFEIEEDENRAWKAMMPALVERCRTWNHTAQCEYVRVDDILLLKGLSNDSESPICSCGIGKFPEDYLKDQMQGFSALKHILSNYATRAAISPIFAVPYVEDCDWTDLANKFCSKCGVKRKLLECSVCQTVLYCSVNCREANLRIHMLSCNKVDSNRV